MRCDTVKTNCPLCAENIYSQLFKVKDSHGVTDNVWEIVLCGRCGLVYLNPRPVEECLTSIFEKGGLYLSSRKTTKAEVRRIGRFKPGRLLDIGCGKGEFLNEAKRLGWDVKGVDMIKRKGMAPDISVEYGRFETVDLPENAYDLITLWGVMEYLREPVSFFNKLKNILKPGGRILFTASNYYSPQIALMKVNNIPRQQLIWSEPSLVYLIRITGFEIEKQDYRNDVRSG